MAGEFRAETFQNEFLPAGTGEVHAIMTVTAGESTDSGGSGGQRLFGILCDKSGSMEGGKIVAARAAMAKLVDLLPPDCSFFIIAGSDDGDLICPVTRADALGKQHAYRAIHDLRAGGGTRISSWLQLAFGQFQTMPGGVRQALLLTDGQNDIQDGQVLAETLKHCEGVFQCDCRGVGTDWRVDQLRQIADALLGTTDIIPSPAEIENDFRGILKKAMSKSVSDVFLRLWTPQGASVKFCKEVSPQIVDLTARAREIKPQLREYPTGAWGKAESRDFHFCIEVAPGAVGDEVLAGRASLVYTAQGVENKAAEARILAVWTDDEGKSTKINHVVAHYTGQAELAKSIQDGLEARAQGQTERATALLGKAVKIAHESGNDATAKLLRQVVDVDDADTGTVRLKHSVAKEDSMALETRSTKTARIAKG
ncbi:von Willebrand factor type A domain-containing protein [Granulicella rosea]|uniref:von Willebrand factor type A domain-containing protein n=1 Tax=Granulicella rosea TaxID=474952 RepID=A0A239MJA3_9BACT|nr:VWA domain-containing protein [Granulicella rosea]SNT42184.1 von Willebrand factor type A domain-containing protein [Granulicella rosea]